MIISGYHDTDISCPLMFALEHNLTDGHWFVHWVYSNLIISDHNIVQNAIPQNASVGSLWLQWWLQIIAHTAGNDGNHNRCESMA